MRYSHPNLGASQLLSIPTGHVAYSSEPNTHTLNVVLVLMPLYDPFPLNTEKPCDLLVTNRICKSDRIYMTIWT